MALAVASVVSTATAGACPASAIVEGPDALRDAANAALEAHAIATLPGAECPAIHARLSSRDGGVLVEVTDTAGRVSERQVTDAATAATWIESWARSDLDSMLLSGPPAGPVAQVEEREHPVAVATAVVPRVVVRGPAVPGDRGRRGGRGARLTDGSEAVHASARAGLAALPKSTEP